MGVSSVVSSRQNEMKAYAVVMRRTGWRASRGALSVVGRIVFARNAKEAVEKLESCYYGWARMFGGVAGVVKVECPDPRKTRGMDE